MDLSSAQPVVHQHSATGPPALNPAGIAYTAIITVYTSLIIFGLVILWHFRGKPAIRIRGFLITFSAVVGLHAFVTCLFVVYPLNSQFTCSSEYWVMSIILPLGIALFQASNVRLMAYATAQRSLIELHTWSSRKQPFTFRPRGFWKWFRQMDYVRRTYFCIGLGLLAQLIVTAVLFAGSRRFRSSGGWFGDRVDEGTCRKGAEWVPSVLWQFLWSWGFGPYVLWKTRKIQDTHYWSISTRLSVLAGLPGTPMWLAFLYSSRFDNFNSYWPAAMWFAPGLMVMQVTSIVMPLLDIYRNNSYQHKRAPSIVSTTSTLVSTITNSSTSSRKSKTLANNYDAFEHQLMHNMQPLFIFAATRDFTAENIQFLREVKDFKRKWQSLGSSTGQSSSKMSSTQKRMMFEDAARIYFELISPSTSRCSINVNSRIYADLEQMFSSLTYEPPTEFPSPRSRRSNHFRRLAQRRKDDVAPWSSPSSSKAALANSADPAGRHSPIALFDVGGLASPAPAVVTHKASDQSIAVTQLPTPASSNGDPFAMLSSVASFSSSPTGNLAAPFADEGTSPLTPYSPTFVSASLHGHVLPKTFAEPGSAAALFVPDSFHIGVFSKAEESIKYLVYTNTWKSYVYDMDDSTAAVLEAAVANTNEARGVPFGSPGGGNVRPSSFGRHSSADKAATVLGLNNTRSNESFSKDEEMEIESEHVYGHYDHHHGVLDEDGDEVHGIDARCAACRRRELTRVAFMRK